MVAVDAALAQSSVRPPEYYGIERVEDGVAYRLLGGKRPLKLLYPVPADEVPRMIAHSIEATVTSLDMLRTIAANTSRAAASSSSRPLGIHLWLNVGYRTTGIATGEELSAALNDLAQSKTLVCKSIGTKYPYEKGITTFADFYKHKAADLRTAISAPNSLHAKCSSAFRALLKSLPKPYNPTIHVHSGTSFEVYAAAVDDFTNMITVGNLFFYGLKPRACAWTLEIQQVAQLPKGLCLDNACQPATKAPMQVATLYNRVPVDSVYLVTPRSSHRLEVLDADLNYGKLVVRVPKSCGPALALALVGSARFEARRTFF